MAPLEELRGLTLSRQEARVFGRAEQRMRRTAPALTTIHLHLPSEAQRSMRPCVEVLEPRHLPSIGFPLVHAGGLGEAPWVYLPAGADRPEARSIAAYDLSFRGGVALATADFNGDGVLDVVTGAGPGGGPHVRLFDGKT